MLLEWAAIFFLLALGAGAFAFTGIADATEIAKLLFYMFSAICVVLLLAGLVLLYDKKVK